MKRVYKIIQMGSEIRRFLCRAANPKCPCVCTRHCLNRKSRRGWFNLNSEPDAIFYDGPNKNNVQTRVRVHEGFKTIEENQKLYPTPQNYPEKTTSSKKETESRKVEW